MKLDAVILLIHKVITFFICWHQLIIVLFSWYRLPTSQFTMLKIKFSLLVRILSTGIFITFRNPCNIFTHLLVILRWLPGHYNKCQWHLNLTLLSCHKSMKWVELCKWLPTNFECAIHKPLLSSCEQFQLASGGKDEVSLAAILYINF